MKAPMKSKTNGGNGGYSQRQKIMDRYVKYPKTGYNNGIPIVKSSSGSVSSMKSHKMMK